MAAVLVFSPGDPLSPQMEAPDAPGFQRLQRLLLAGKGFADDVHRKRAGATARLAVLSTSFERGALNFAVPARTRLARLASLQRMVEDTDLMPVDRKEIMLELDRYGMRILWSEKIVENVLESDAPADQRAAALLTLIARGQLPSGACAKSALEPAKALLVTKEAHEALIASPQLRDQMMQLLESAQHAPSV